MNDSSKFSRIEDGRLLRGQGRFVADRKLAHQCFGVVVRSPYPHAEIKKIDTSQALDCPGVLTILTGADLEDEGIGGLPCVSSFNNQDGSPISIPDRPLLAVERARYVGEPVAFVVAATMNEAMDAAEAVDIAYFELPSTSSTQSALTATPMIWEQNNNLCYDWSMGDEQEVQEIMDQSARVASIQVQHQRIAVTPIEPRAAVGEFNPEEKSYTLTVQTQGVHSVRRVIAENVLKIPKENLRVITQDVGGSFGMKIFTYPEYALVLIAAKKTGRPVSWTATRSESFVSDTQARARTDFAEISYDSDGNMTALRMDIVADLGAYASYVGPNSPSIYAATVIGHTYRIPKIFLRSRGVFTNAPPTDAYRGAGKPETVCTLEQLIDKSAFEMKVDRIDLRRRNLVRQDELPYSMPNGEIIDSGNFPALLDQAMQMADWSEFPARREDSLAEGKLRGIGFGMYLHSTSGSPGEVCEVKLCEDGTVLVLSGTQSAGQGHETALAEIVSRTLEVDIQRVHVRQGDTDDLDSGGGTGGSSFLAIAGNTVVRAAHRMLEHAIDIASELLEASRGDIEYTQGEFRVAGTDLLVTIDQVALYSNLPKHTGPTDCVGRTEFEGTKTTHPSGAYVAEIECDPATGELRICQLAGVDDIGRIIAPVLADGQLHGAWAQAVGSSFMEGVCYDEDETGQSLNGTLMDYQLPRAGDLPYFQLKKLTTESLTNPTGVKGAGEAANLGAPGALMNALSNMISTDKFVIVKPPATPFQLWQAISSENS